MFHCHSCIVCAPVNKFPNSEINRLFGSRPGTETVIKSSSVRCSPHRFTQFVMMDFRLSSHDAKFTIFQSGFFFSNFIKRVPFIHILENRHASTAIISVFFFVKALGRSASAGRKGEKMVRKSFFFFFFPNSFVLRSSEPQCECSRSGACSAANTKDVFSERY